MTEELQITSCRGCRYNRYDNRISHPVGAGQYKLASLSCKTCYVWSNPDQVRDNYDPTVVPDLPNIKPRYYSTVVLAIDGTDETHIALVHSPIPPTTADSIRLARAQAHRSIPEIPPEDFVPVAVFEGHHISQI